jgi:acyl-coenzyme A thioesterase PaaI-like protein
VAAAEALRRLGNAIVGHQVDDALLERIAKAANGLLPEIEAGTPRERDAEYLKRAVFQIETPAEGETIHHFPDCFVSGPANPLGVAMTVQRDGEDAVARVVLGPAFEGAPQRAHGGIVAAIFDDVMGYVMAISGTPAYTGRLQIAYHQPTPVAEELVFRARVTGRERRKVLVESQAYNAAGEKVASSEGVFVTIPPERLGLPKPDA